MYAKKLIESFVTFTKMRKFASHYNFAPYQRDFEHFELNN